MLKNVRGCWSHTAKEKKLDSLQNQLLLVISALLFLAASLALLTGFHSYAWGFMVPVWLPLSQVQGRREENGAILAASVSFVRKKNFSERPPLISHWPEVCHMASSLCKGGNKATEYLAFFRFQSRSGQGRRELRINVRWVGKHRVSPALTLYFFYAPHSTQWISGHMNWLALTFWLDLFNMYM